MISTALRRSKIRKKPAANEITKQSLSSDEVFGRLETDQTSDPAKEITKERENEKRSSAVDFEKNCFKTIPPRNRADNTARPVIIVKKYTKR